MIFRYHAQVYAYVYQSFEVGRAPTTEIEYKVSNFEE